MGRRITVLAAFCAMVVALCGCFSHERRVRSNALQYLYPSGSPERQPGDVRLTLPVRVGIVFTPEDRQQSALDATLQSQLLERVAAAFRGRDGIAGVDVIPSSFLRAGGGFEDLRRVRSAFGVDLVALVSYDQFQFSGRGASSLLYWTIVGTYVVKGEKNTTRTMLDTLVYDLPSQAMLFHASGQSTVGGRSTPIKADLALRKDTETGFALAADDLILKVDQALAAFVEQAKSGTVRGPGTPAIAFLDESGKPTSPGGGGGGALGVWEAAAALLLAAAGLAARRRSAGARRAHEGHDAMASPHEPSRAG